MCVLVGLVYLSHIPIACMFFSTNFWEISLTQANRRVKADQDDLMV